MRIAAIVTFTILETPRDVTEGLLLGFPHGGSLPLGISLEQGCFSFSGHMNHVKKCIPLVCK